MPERKGRKRKPTRERNRGGTETVTRAAVVDPPQPRNAAPNGRRAASSDGPLPSTFARVTGLMLAVVTAVLAIGMVYQAASGAAGGIDQIGRMVAGALLVALAIVVGVLSVAPAMVRDFFQRRRS